jgi:hypothetical protein
VGLRPPIIPRHASPVWKVVLAPTLMLSCKLLEHREARDKREVVSIWNIPLDYSQCLWILLEAPGISEPLLSWFNFINIYQRTIRMMSQLQAIDCLKWSGPGKDN